jgi:hypothetical protein
MSDNIFDGAPPAQVLLIAVQRPDGAMILGWTAAGGGDTWTFDTVSTLPMLRARADQWDGIGMAALSLGTGRRALAEEPQSQPDGTPAPPSPPGMPGLPGGPAAPGMPATPGGPAAPTGVPSSP